MGYPPCQSVPRPSAFCPSMHRKGTDGRPCAPPSEPPGSCRGSRAETTSILARRGLCGTCVLFCLSFLPPERCLVLGEQSRALPAPLLKLCAPGSPGSAPRPSLPAPRTRPAPPRTATAWVAALPSFVRVRDSSSLSGQQGAEWSLHSRGGGWRGLCLEGKGVGKNTASFLQPWFRFWDGGKPSTEAVRRRRQSFVVSVGSGLGSLECRKLAMPPDTRAPCPIGRPSLQGATGTGGSGLCSLTQVRRSDHSLRGAQPLSRVPISAFSRLASSLPASHVSRKHRVLHGGASACCALLPAPCGPSLEKGFQEEG